MTPSRRRTAASWAEVVRESGPLAGVAAASLVVYVLAFQRAFPLETWWQNARLDYAWLTRYELAGQVRFVGAFVVLFLLNGWACAWAWAEPTRAPLWLILGGQALLSLPLVTIYPIAALDLYDYLLYGRLAVYWGANPLAELPASYPGEPLVAYSYWPNEPSVYGPLWQAASELLTRLVGGQMPDGLYAFKLLAVAAGLLTTVVVWWIVGWRRPDLAPAAALVFGWNPLVLFELAGNGHNDGLMVMWLALALLALALGRRWLGLPALTAGLLVKVSLAPLAPLFLCAPLAWRGARRWAAASLGLLGGVLLAGALYAPYWRGRASLPFLDRGNWFTASPPTLLRELLRSWLPFESAGRTAALLCGLVFLALALAILARLLLHPAGDSGVGFDRFVRAAYQTYFAYLVIGCLWWQPWYLLVLVLLAALSRDQRLIDRTNLFAFGGLLSYPVFKYVWAVHQADWQLDYVKIMTLSVVAIFSLPLGHLAWCWLRPLRGPVSAPAAPPRAP